MSFIFSKSIKNSDFGVQLFHLKTTLVLAGWIVKASGDGLSAYSSTGDIITTLNSGAGGMSNANAWFRIQMPTINGVTREFTFQRSSAGTFINKYSFSAGFITGGSATVTPTSTDQQSINSINNGNIVFSNIVADNAAPYGFALFNYLYASPGSTNNNGGMIFEGIVPGTGPALDPDPYIIYVEDNLSGVFNSAKFSTNGSNGLPKAWFNKGLVDEFYDVVGAGTIHNGVSPLFPSGAGTDPYSLKEQIGPMMWLRGQGVTRGLGFKGIGYIMKMNGTIHTSGENLSFNSPRDRIVCADVNFPWDGTLAPR